MIGCAELAFARAAAGTGDGRPLANIATDPAIRACGNIALDFAANRQPAWAAPCPEPSE